MAQEEQEEEINLQLLDREISNLLAEQYKHWSRQVPDHHDGRSVNDIIECIRWGKPPLIEPTGGGWQRKRPATEEEDSEYVKGLVEKLMRWDISSPETNRRDNVGANVLDWLIIMGAGTANTRATASKRQRRNANDLAAYSDDFVNGSSDQPSFVETRGPDETRRVRRAINYMMSKAVSARPALVFDEYYTDAQYKGESVLHLLIISGLKSNFENLLRELMRFDHATIYRTLDSCTTGAFYNPGNGLCYVGAFPLHFASSVGSEWMVHKLLQASPDNHHRMKMLVRPDPYGSTPLHMAVRHTRVGMIHFLLDQIERVVEDIYDDLRGKGRLDVKVQEYKRAALRYPGPMGLSPLQLATLLAADEGEATEENSYGPVARAVLAELSKPLFNVSWLHVKELDTNNIDSVPTKQSDDSESAPDFTAQSVRSRGWLEQNLKHTVTPWQLMELVCLLEIKLLALNKVIVMLRNEKEKSLAPIFYTTLAFHLALITVLILLVLEFVPIVRPPSDSPQDLNSTAPVATATLPYDPEPNTALKNYEIIALVLICCRLIVTICDIGFAFHKRITTLNKTEKLRRDRLTAIKDGHWTGSRTSHGVCDVDLLPTEVTDEEKAMLGEHPLRGVCNAKEIFGTLTCWKASSIVPLDRWDWFGVYGQILFIVHFSIVCNNNWDKLGNDGARILLSASLGLIVTGSLSYFSWYNSLASLTIVVFKGLSAIQVFIVIYLVFLAACSIALFIAFDKQESYSTLAYGVDYLVRASFNVDEHVTGWYEPKQKTGFRVWTYIITLIFTLLSVVILMNMLITIFTDLYAEVKTGSKEIASIAMMRKLLLLENRVLMLEQVFGKCCDEEAYSQRCGSDWLRYENTGKEGSSSYMTEIRAAPLKEEHLQPEDLEEVGPGAEKEDEAKAKVIAERVIKRIEHRSSPKSRSIEEPISSEPTLDSASGKLLPRGAPVIVQYEDRVYEGFIADGDSNSAVVSWVTDKDWEVRGDDAREWSPAVPWKQIMRHPFKPRQPPPKGSLEAVLQQHHVAGKRGYMEELHSDPSL